MKYCSECGQPLEAGVSSCPKCGALQRREAAADIPGADKKIPAGVCGILLGWLGVHKFILGYTTAGIIMLAFTLCTCGAGAAVTWIIGLIEGIIYLTKSDEDFVQTYVRQERQWF